MARRSAAAVVRLRLQKCCGHGDVESRSVHVEREYAVKVSLM